MPEINEEENLTFEQFLQNSCGAAYSLEDMFTNLSDEEISEEIEKYVFYRTEKLEKERDLWKETASKHQ